MDNKATTKRMIGAVVLVLVAALLLAWLLKGKNREGQAEMAMNEASETKPILGFPDMADPGEKPAVVQENQDATQQNNAQNQGVIDEAANAVKDAAGNLKDTASNVVSSVGVNTVKDTTGFELRPASTNETRKAVDKDGTLVNTNGSLGSGSTNATQGKDTNSKSGNTAQQQANGSASNKDIPIQEKETKQTPRPVLVNEKRVPTPSSVESKAKAAQQAAADRAAAAKSIELAKGNATKPSSVAGAYTIQVLASSDKGKADAKAAAFRADGYPASVTSAKVGGKTVYRVIVGSYADKVAAAAAQAKMKSRYTQPGVQQSFITSK